MTFPTLLVVLSVPCDVPLSFPGRSALSFYTVPEYNQWKLGHNNGKGWIAKYYKVNGYSTEHQVRNQPNE